MIENKPNIYWQNFYRPHKRRLINKLFIISIYFLNLKKIDLMVIVG